MGSGLVGVGWVRRGEGGQGNEGFSLHFANVHACVSGVVCQSHRPAIAATVFLVECHHRHPRHPPTPHPPRTIFALICIWALTMLIEEQSFKAYTKYCMLKHRQAHSLTWVFICI